ncbi:hypothetical protein [Weizmannia acidilactici]|nr:hypothetical protein [Weizmannia acidilactici]
MLRKILGHLLGHKNYRYSSSYRHGKYHRYSSSEKATHSHYGYKHYSKRHRSSGFFSS